MQTIKGCCAARWAGAEGASEVSLKVQGEKRHLQTVGRAPINNFFFPLSQHIGTIKKFNATDVLSAKVPPSETLQKPFFCILKIPYDGNVLRNRGQNVLFE